MECRNPECSEELDTDDCFGGDIECKKCGWHHDTSFDTCCGLYIDGPCGPEESRWDR